MQRAIAWLCSIVLATATGAALSGTVAVLTAPFPEHASAGADAELALSFYDAANTVLRTGDTGPLAVLLAPDMVEHNPAPGLPPTREGLIRHLLGLHATVPDIQLAPEEAFAADDRVMARVRVDGNANRSFLGASIGDDPHPWGTLDQFRVLDGRIVEHWSSMVPEAVLETLHHVHLDRWFSAGQIVALERYTWAPGTRLWSRMADDAHLIYLESGTLTVTLDPYSAAATLFSAGDGTASHRADARPVTISPGTGATLVPGDLLALSTPMLGTVRNDGDVPAEALVVAASLSGSASRSRSQSDAANVPAAPSAFSATIVPLAGGTKTTLPVNQAAVGLGRAVVAPGSTVIVDESAGPLLLVVESGSVDVAVDEERPWVRRTSDGISYATEGGTLAAGDGALIHPGTATKLRNPGSEPAVLLLVTILPDDSAPLAS